ncbi:MFS transporter [Catenulispora rubra]|uniref:MFS transporter n=1 Tax=Catenulispora rubra TaxID=280293 RepID=UPI0018923617|nr:MFS transporter [Catenulispora rubra]
MQPNILRALSADKRILTVLAAEWLSTFGDQMLFIVVALWVRQTTGSASRAGLTFFAMAVGGAITPLVAFRIDRWRRLSVLRWTNILTAVAVASLGLAGPRHGLWLVYAVMAAYGLSGAVSGSASGALLPDLVPRADLGRVNGMNTSVSQAIRIVAPPAGAGVLVWAGAHAVVMIDFLTFVVAAVMLSFTKIEESPGEPEAGRYWHTVLAGARHLRRQHSLRDITAACVATMLVVGFLETLIFPVVTDGLHRPVSFIGVLSAAQGAGAVIGGLAAAAFLDRLRPPSVVALGIAFLGTGTALVAIPSITPVIFGMVLTGVAIPCLSVGAATAIQHETPDFLLGRTFTAFSFALNTPSAISIALGAEAAAVLDYRLAIASVAALLGAVATSLLFRSASSDFDEAGHEESIRVGSTN